QEFKKNNNKRVADRFVRSDPGGLQRGSGQQPGAVDPPVDRDLCAGACQYLAAERSAAPALIAAKPSTYQNGGALAPPFFCLPRQPAPRPCGNDSAAIAALTKSIF